MPSIYVHNYFAKEVNKKIKDLNVRQINDDTYMNIFAQSFDNLFYYNFYKIKGKEYQKLGHYAHTHKTWEYFKNMLEYVKQNNKYDDENLGYIYGSICHYQLDSTAHPYIHYFSGRYDKKNKKETKKYIGNHAVNEIMLDAIYFSKNNKITYNKFKVYKELIPKIEFSNNLKDTINYVFSKTFNKKNIGQIYNKAYNQSRLSYKYLMYDRFGIKKKIYRIVDFFTPNKNFKAYTYSNGIKKIDKEILNENNNIWLHPITGDKHNESFNELYITALDKSIESIESINKYFQNKLSIDQLESIIKNDSYSTGLNCDARSKFTYFKY